MATILKYDKEERKKKEKAKHKKMQTIIQNKYGEAEADIARMNMKINNGHQLTEEEAFDLLLKITEAGEKVDKEIEEMK